MKIKTTQGRFAVLFLLAFFILAQLTAPPITTAAAAVSWQNITADVPAGGNTIASSSQSKSIGFWHYSGGYWRATVDGTIVQFSDSQVQDGLANIATLVGNTIEMQFDLPEAVINAISAGKDIGIAAVYGKTDLFSGAPQFKIENGKMYFKATPQFNFVKSKAYNYKTFISNLDKFIPFPDPAYGWNMYSMFKGSTNIGAATGYFDPSDPSKLGAEGTIHPTQIADSSGKLKSGFTVNIGGTSYNSADLSIGSGTFASAGAVGLHFYYPVTFTFYEVPQTVDLSVTMTGKIMALPGESCTITASVKNDSKLPADTTVNLTLDTIKMDKPVSLAAGETKTIDFTFNAPSKTGDYTLDVTVDPDKKINDTNRQNNTAENTFTVRTELIDVASYIIGPLVANPLEKVNLTVQAQNRGDKQITTQVTLTVTGVTQSKDVTLAGGESKNVTFQITAPASGTMSLVSNIDPNNKLNDADRSNNKSTATLQVQHPPAETISNCSTATITWSETSSHNYTVRVTRTKTVSTTASGYSYTYYTSSASGSGFTWNMTGQTETNQPTVSYNSGGYSGTLSKTGYSQTGDSGGPPAATSAGQSYTWTRTYTGYYSGTVSGVFDETRTCDHVYNYQANLTVDPVKFLYNDKNTHNMKSGYGFYLEAVTRMSSSQTGNSGVCGTSRSKSHSATLTAPTQVFYYAPTTAKPATATNRLGTQPSRVQLASNGSSPVTTYTTAANPISETKQKKIYTDPNWADRTHYFDMLFQGGGVAGKIWCYTRYGSTANNQYIIIKGNMYEDDHTG